MDIEKFIRDLPRDVRLGLAEILGPQGLQGDTYQKVDSFPNNYARTAKEFKDMGERLQKQEEKQVGVDLEKMEQSVRLFFEAIGDDPNRDGIKDTPRRVAKMYAETMNGYFLKPEDYVTTFENDSDYDGPVILRDAEFYTQCEHHLQPFAGTIDIAYKPGERIIGLSKLLRVARVFAKRPQVQERLTKEVADALQTVLDPTWVVVRIRAEHHCMKLRGVRINGSHTETRYGHGLYPKDIF